MDSLKLQDRKVIDVPKLLFTEGESDKIFLQKYCEILGIEDVLVLNLGGNSKLANKNPESALPYLIQEPNFQRLVHTIGIVVDGDNDKEKAFEDIQKQLQLIEKERGTVTIAVPEKENIFAGAGIPKNPRIGIFVINECLEALCFKLLHSDDQLRMSYVNDFHQSLLSFEDIPSSIHKLKMQVFLATKREINSKGKLTNRPTKELGIALKNNCFDLSSLQEELQLLRKFIEETGNHHHA